MKNRPKKEVEQAILSVKGNRLKGFTLTIKLSTTWLKHFNTDSEICIAKEYLNECWGDPISSEEYGQKEWTYFDVDEAMAHMYALQDQIEEVNKLVLSIENTEEEITVPLVLP